MSRLSNRSLRRIQNDVLFSVTEDGRAVDTSEGVTITARLKRWGTANLNGEIYQSDSYDEFIASYYEAQGLNLPLTLMHGGGWQDIAGKVTAVEKDAEGLTITAVILRNLPNFDHVMALVDAGLLQGVSDEGFATDFVFNDDKEGTVTIRKACIMGVSLVTTPAEQTAKLTKDFQNTAFKGFASSLSRLRARRQRRGGQEHGND